tara:strand:+ start:428 stop:685 length:258 start_codon:yes stop_codon:yes gene_type:complete
MEIDTNISIEIDEDEWAIELDLDGRIKQQIEDFVDDEWIEKIVRQTIALNPDMVRDIVHEEITTAINNIGSVLVAMIGPKENNNA